MIFTTSSWKVCELRSVIRSIKSYPKHDISQTRNNNKVYIINNHYQSIHENNIDHNVRY